MKALVIAAVAAALALAAPGHALADVSVPVSGSLCFEPDCSVGTSKVFLRDAAFTLDSFAVENGTLVARGTLSGAYTDIFQEGAGEPPTPFGSVSATLAVTTITASCGSVAIALAGPVLVYSDIAPRYFSVSTDPGSPLRIDSSDRLSCAVARLLTANGSPHAVASLLNQLLQRV